MRFLLFLIALLVFIPKTHSQDAFKFDDLPFLGVAVPSAGPVSDCTTTNNAQTYQNDSTSHTLYYIGQGEYTNVSEFSCCAVSFWLLTGSGDISGISYTVTIAKSSGQNMDLSSLGSTYWVSESKLGSTLTLPGWNKWTFSSPVSMEKLPTKYHIVLGQGQTARPKMYDGADAGAVWFTGTKSGYMWQGGSNGYFTNRFTTFNACFALFQ